MRAEGKVLHKDFEPTDDLGDLAGSVIFQADHLKGSGIADLTLSASAVQGDDTSQSRREFSPGTITFKGDVTLGGLDNLFLDASRLSLVDVDLDTEGCHVCLSARYVALRGAGNAVTFMPTEGPGRLRVEGDTIDIAAGSSTETALLSASGVLSLSGVASARFVSNGDIRLRVPLSKVGNQLIPGVLPAGELITAGNLTFQAQQIYPISNVDFTLKSIAPNGTIAFVDGGTAPSLPLSAGWPAHRERRDHPSGRNAACSSWYDPAWRACQSRPERPRSHSRCLRSDPDRHARARQHHLGFARWADRAVRRNGERHQLELR